MSLRHGRRRLASILLAVLGVLAVLVIGVLAQVVTTQVTDTIYRADGTPAKGTVLISWPAFTTATGQAVASGSTSATLAAGGSLMVQLIPNAGANPIGSYYTAVYHLDDGSVSREYWVVPVSQSPVSIRSIRSTVLPISVAMQTVSKSYVDTAIAAAISGHPVDSSGLYILKTGDSMTGPLTLPGDPAAPSQAATKSYVDHSIAANAGGLSLLPGATADYNFLQGAGTTVTDGTAHGNDAGLSSGSGTPSWTSTGLSFAPGQGVAMPAALNGTRTFFVAVYINPLTSGPQPSNNFPVLISSSGGTAGFNFMYEANTSTGNLIPMTYAPRLYVNGNPTTTAPNLLSGFHVLAVTLGTGGGAVDHLYIDGMEVAAYYQQGASAGAQTTGNLFLGSSNVSPWMGSGFNGIFYRLRTYPTQLAAGDVQTVSAGIRNEVANRGVAVMAQPVVSAVPQLHAIGDSITFGTGASTPWVSLLTLSNQPAYLRKNWGIYGITLHSIEGSEANRVALQCQSNAEPSIAIVFAGTNDLSGGSTPDDTFSSLAGEIQMLKRAGCKVFAGTMLSRAGTDGRGIAVDLDKNIYDALILSKAKQVGADGVIDYAANPLLGADGAYANIADFNADGVHPNQAGQQLLANATSNVLNYAFGYSETNPHNVTALPYSMTAGDGAVLLNGVTSAGALTLPDCTGQSGATYSIRNLQSAFAITVVPLNANQPVNGLNTAVTVPSNGTLTLRDIPNPKTVSGCHWEM